MSDKPFDLLVIRSPDEYRFHNGDYRTPLMNLSQICRNHDIPVRVEEPSSRERYILNGFGDDMILALFAQCDYNTGIPYESLAEFSDGQEVIVMVTGGMFDVYENASGEFEGTRCVAHQASVLYHKIAAQGKAPLIFIDARSVASLTPEALDPDQLYLVTSTNGPNVLIKGVGRSPILQRLEAAVQSDEAAQTAHP